MHCVEIVDLVVALTVYKSMCLNLSMYPVPLHLVAVYYKTVVAAVAVVLEFGLVAVAAVVDYLQPTHNHFAVYEVTQAMDGQLKKETFKKKTIC